MNSGKERLSLRWVDKGTFLPLLISFLVSGQKTKVLGQNSKFSSNLFSSKKKFLVVSGETKFSFPSWRHNVPL